MVVNIYKVKKSGVPVSLRSPLDFESVNHHVLICGSSGSGKSYFAKHLFPDPDGLILFKKDDGLFNGKDIIDVSVRGLPDIFNFKVYDVSDAYMYALKINFSGIMASSIVPVFSQAFLKSLPASRSRVRNSSPFPPARFNLDLFRAENPHSKLSGFPFFLKVLESNKSHQLISSVSSLILSHFEVLYPASQEFRGDSVLNHSKFSFANIGTFRSEFGAELILRNYYSSMNKDNGVLMIDEFHHVSRPGSIIDTLLREFRIAGRLVAISQNLSDLSPSMLSNFGYILIGRSIHPDDLLYLSRIAPELPVLVSSLPKYTFLNLSEYLLNKSDLPLYRWFVED